MEFIHSLRANIRKHHISAYSGHMAFFLMMSIFPFLIVVFTLVGKLSLDSQFLIEYMRLFVPTEIGSFLEDYITTISFNPTGVISISLVVAIWSSSRAVHALIRALNVVFEVDEGRPYWKLRFTGFFYTLIMVLAIVLFLFLPVIGGRLLEALTPFIRIPMVYITLYSYLRWVLITVTFFLAILAIYKKLPGCRVTVREAIWGAGFALAGWLLNALTYSFIITNFSRISLIYGGLSAIILLSFWLYIDSIIILLGAEVVHYRQKKIPA